MNLGGGPKKETFLVSHFTCVLNDRYPFVISFNFDACNVGGCFSIQSFLFSKVVVVLLHSCKDGRILPKIV